MFLSDIGLPVMEIGTTPMISILPKANCHRVIDHRGAIRVFTCRKIHLRDGIRCGAGRVTLLRLPAARNARVMHRLVSP
jgi:hypothetical protein